MVLTARSEDAIEQVAAQVRSKGGRAIAVAADVTDPEALEEVMESALDQFNRVDILINNAGVIWPVDELAEVDADEWTYNIFTNLIGPFYLARMVLPLMLEQNSGRILNVSSAVVQQPIAGLSAYAAAKAGLDMWTRTLALELKGRNVTANLLYPGHTDTAMQEDLRSIDTTSSNLDFGFFQRTHDDGLLRSPAFVADLIFWLAGPWARGRSGETFSASDATWLAQVQQDLA